MIKEGLQAGFFLALTDWAAGGVLRTPLALALLTLVSFTVGGLIAGLIGAAVRRRGIAFALAVGGALAVHGVSIISKNVADDNEIKNLLVTAAAIIALHYGAFAGWVFAKKILVASQSKLSQSLSGLILASGVAVSSLTIWAYPEQTVTFTLLSALLLPALAWLLARQASAIRGIVAIAIVGALATPVALYDHEPPRRFVPEKVDVVAAPGSPNVVLLVVDTFRADHLDQAPNLSSLATEGALFTQSVSSASWTLPAISSMLTSLYPSQHGAVMATTTLPGSVDTLAESFHAAGYETAAFTGGAFVSPAFGLDQGFEYFDHLAEFNFRPFRIHTPLVWRLAKNRYFSFRPLLRHINEFGGLPSVVTKVHEWLDVRSTERPYFLLVHTYQIHDYYIYHPDPDDEVMESLGPLSATFAGRLSVHPSELIGASQADLDWFHGIYKGRIGHVDNQVGRLFELLAEHSGDAPMISAMTSDHGEGFDAARQRVHHGDRLHDDLLRVPFILNAPGQIEPGTRVDQQVRSIDLMPTLLDLAGLEIPANLSGQSLLGSLRTNSNWPIEAFGEEITENRQKIALRTLDWKIIQAKGAQVSEQTYHLSEDALEDSPSLKPAPTLLLEQLGNFRSRYPERDREESVIDEATQDHLRALGYID
ncbi:MAG: arylsulfatase A-like enzyme [Planctomycetota bacterium]|jgi:arylsulfatase A-like enzyme